MAEQVLAMKLVGDIGDFQRKWATANTQLTTFGNKAEMVGKKIGTLGRQMMVLSVPAAIAVGASIRAFSNFDNAMTQSLAIMGDVTSQQRKMMEDLAKQMSTESTFAAKDLAESYFFLASAGLDVDQSMKALPVVTKFAQAGMFDMASATDLLTDAYSALGPQVQKTGDIMQDMSYLGDILVKANTLANASVQQFSEALTNEAGAAMRNFNIEIEDGIAVLAAFADQGIKGNVAGSMFGRALRLMTKAARENASEFEKMGIAVFDAQGEVRPFANIAEDMERALGSLSTQARSAALAQLGFEARIQQAIVPLIGASEKIRDYRTELGKAAGITKEVAEKQLESFAAQVKLLRNELGNLGIELGQAFIPTVRSMVESLKGAVQWFSGLSDGTKKTIVTTLAFIAVAGPLLIVLGKLLTLLKGVGPVLKGIGVAASFLAAHPLVALGLMIAGTIALFVKLCKIAHETEEAYEQLAESTKITNQLEAEHARLRAESGGQSIRNIIKNNTRAREDYNKALEAGLTLEQTIAQIERIAGREHIGKATAEWLQGEIERLKKEGLAVAELAQTGEAKPASYVQNEADRKAELEVMGMLDEYALSQLDTQQKLNELIARRNALNEEALKVQKNSAEYFEIQKKALELEKEIRAAGESRASEIIAQVEERRAAPKFAAAVEEGSVEAYRAKIGAEDRREQDRLQKDANKELEKLNKRIEESTDILRNGFQALTGFELKEVAIL